MEHGRDRVERQPGMAKRARSLYGLAFTVVAVCGVLVAGGGVALAASDPTYFNPDASSQLRSGVAPGKCLDIKAEDGINRDLSRAQLWDCDGASVQNFTFSFAQTAGSGQNYYYITTAGSKCLEYRGGALTNGTQVDQISCSLRPEQLWYLTFNGDGTYTVHNLLGNCLDVNAASSANGTHVQEWACNGTDAQRWSGGDGQPNPCSDEAAFPQGSVSCGYDHLTRLLFDNTANNGFNNCISPSPGDLRGNGAALLQEPCNEFASEQFWTMSFALFESGVVYYHIINGLSGLCIDASLSTQQTAQMFQFTCQAPANRRSQLWQAVNAPGGLTYLVNSHGLCMDVSWASPNPGAVIWQWPCNGTVAQSFLYSFFTAHGSGGF
jgi:hypothetical protein